MHRLLVEELIAGEVARVREDARLRDRVELEQEETRVLVRARRQGQPVLIALDGRNYDADPFGVMMLDPESRDPLPAESWPPDFCNGVHPVLNRPWTCLQGTYEFYRFPGHQNESWDQVRYDLDLPTLLGQLLHKSGCE